MKYHKFCLLIGISLLAAVGGLAIPREQANKSGDKLGDKSGTVFVAGEDLRIRVSTRKDPEGQWLNLVSWEELKEGTRFDEVQPFYGAKRVLIVKDGNCAVISRQTWVDRVNAEIEALK